MFGRTLTAEGAELGTRQRRALSHIPHLVFAVGDVHGCHTHLLEMEKRISREAAELGKPALIVYLGDLVDRGPESAAVIEHFCNRQKSNVFRVALCGNHDDSFLKFVEDPAANMQWLGFGGTATLASYGIDAGHILKHGGGLEALKQTMREAIPEQHLEFLRQMPVCLTIGDFLFVHAGIVPGVELESQSDTDMMWMRDPFLQRGPELPLTVIHGHTASPNPIIANGRICLDTGAYATGKLTALRIARGMIAGTLSVDA
jgi:serine/threonine protein phosphatase 1